MAGSRNEPPSRASRRHRSASTKVVLTPVMMRCHRADNNGCFRELECSMTQLCPSVVGAPCPRTRRKKRAAWTEAAVTLHESARGWCANKLASVGPNQGGDPASRPRSVARHPGPAKSHRAPLAQTEVQKRTKFPKSRPSARFCSGLPPRYLPSETQGLRKSPWPSDFDFWM